MNLQEAIEVLKDAMYIGSDEYASDYDRRMKEAIDTVITELEKPTTPKEIEDARKFIRECHADIGFMGSPEYYEKRKMIEDWDKKRRKQNEDELNGCNRNTQIAQQRCNGGCCDNGTGYCMFCEKKLI